MTELSSMYSYLKGMSEKQAHDSVLSKYFVEATLVGGF